MNPWEQWLRSFALQIIELQLVVLAVAMILWPGNTRTKPSAFLWLENHFGRLARKKTLSVVVVGLTAIVLRGGLVPILAVPEPYYHDEFSYLLAADTFAHGRLTNPTHPMWKHFESFHINQLPTYMSMYPPAEGMILAAGQLLGHPWLGNLFVTALMCSALCWMLQGWLPPAWALLGGMLAVLRLGVFGYWINGYWCASIAAFAGALVLGALPRLKRNARARDAMWMALGVAILANSRPYEGLVLSLIVAVPLLVWLAGPRRPRFPILLSHVITPIVLILAISAVATGYYNYRVTGSPLRMGYEVNRSFYSRARYFIWQGPSLPKPTYRFAVMENFYERTEFKYYSDNRTLVRFLKQSWAKIAWYWRFFLNPVLTIPLLALPWVWRDRRMRFPLLALGVFLLALAVETWFRPHYFAPATCLLYLVLVQGMRHLKHWHWRGRLLGPALVRAVPVICLFMVVLRVSAIEAHVIIEDPWPRGNIARAKLLRTMETWPGQHLVIVRYGPAHRFPDPEWVYNAADIDSAKMVWARDMGERDNQELMQYFRERKVWALCPEDLPLHLEPLSPSAQNDPNYVRALQ